MLIIRFVVPVAALVRNKVGKTNLKNKHKQED